MNKNWQSIEPSIFSKMSQLAAKHGAVNLAQGFPDFDGPLEIKNAAIEAIKAQKNQYAPARGIDPLKKIFANKFFEAYGINFDESTEVSVFSGATEALFCSALALLEKDDEIITFEPFYESYETYPFLNNTKLTTVPLNSPDWSFSEEKFEKSLTKNTKILLLNCPHNPTGKVFTKNELEFLRKMVIKYNLTVITDEVYEKLVYDSHKHIPFCTLEGMKDRTITIQSTSKTFSLTGWKVGYILANQKWIDVISNVHQNTVFCSATPLQWGLLAIESLKESYYKNLLDSYFEKRKLLTEGLQKIGFECNAPDGSYFLLANYENFSDLPDIEFSKWLTEKVGVATIPISVFYKDKLKALETNRYLRFGFCKEISTIQKALINLDKLTHV